jgi:hypothetical protein
LAETKGLDSVIIWLIRGLVVLIALNQAALAKTYVNAEYGLQAELPSRKMICTTDNDGTTSDHGFTVLWATNKCPPEENTLGIYIYFGMNAFESRSTFEEGQHICHSAAIRPSPFSVSGFRFYQCTRSPERGRIRLEYFVLRHVEGDDPEGEPTYGVSMICPHTGCRELMPTTRWIFTHMRFNKPDW